MRLLVAGSLLLLAAAMPVQAQFEGTLKIKMTGNGNAPVSDITYMIKGDRVAYSMQSPMAQGMDVHMIIDNANHKMTMLVPMMPQMAQMPGMEGAKGVMVVMNTDQAAAMATKGTPPTWKDLGTSETIAGYKCEDFEFTSDKTVTRACMSKELGKFAFGGAGSMGRSARGVPSWVSAMGDASGFPLKVWTPDGKVGMEVTSVEKGSIPDSAFAVPDGYKDMSSMFGGMMGGRGGGQR